MKMSEKGIRSGFYVSMNARTRTLYNLSYSSSFTQGTSLSLETRTSLSMNGVQLSLEISASSPKLSQEQRRFILDKITEVLNESSNSYEISHPSITGSPVTCAPSEKKG